MRTAHIQSLTWVRLSQGKGTPDKNTHNQPIQSSVLGGWMSIYMLQFGCDQHPTGKLTLGFFTGNTYLQGFKRNCFCEPEAKCKRHLVNSKYLDGKKLNLNTFIREHHPIRMNKGFVVFSFSKSSLLCVFSFVIFFQLIVAFGYKLLSFYLLTASQLFKVPIGCCYYLAFQSSPLIPCSYPDNPT